MKLHNFNGCVDHLPTNISILIKKFADKIK